MRRNVVEGVFGHLKNEAGEHLKRGNIRAFGIAENALLVAFVVAAQNLRMLQTFRERYSLESEESVGEFEVGPYDDTPEGRMYASGRQQRPATSIAEVRQSGHRIRCGETV